MTSQSLVSCILAVGCFHCHAISGVTGRPLKKTRNDGCPVIYDSHGSSTNSMPWFVTRFQCLHSCLANLASYPRHFLVLLLRPCSRSPSLRPPKCFAIGTKTRRFAAPNSAVQGRNGYKSRAKRGVAGDLQPLKIFPKAPFAAISVAANPPFKLF